MCGSGDAGCRYHYCNGVPSCYPSAVNYCPRVKAGNAPLVTPPTVLALFRLVHIDIHRSPVLLRTTVHERVVRNPHRCPVVSSSWAVAPLHEILHLLSMILTPPPAGKRRIVISVSLSSAGFKGPSGPIEGLPPNRSYFISR